jgi:type I restriction enzyme S subunit
MVPEGWQTKNLGNLAEIIGGTTPSKKIAEYWGGDICWATPSDVTALPVARRFIADTAAKITHTGLSGSSLKVLPPGSVLMTSRATIGEVVINRCPMATNQGFCNFIPGDLLDAEFLASWLRHSKPKLISLAGGSTFLEIGKKSIKNLEILFPPLPEQKKIAAILGSVDEAIQATQAVIDQTSKVKQGLLQQLLTRGIGHTRFKQTEIGEIPEGWEVAMLDNVSKRGTGHTPAKKHPDYWNGGIKWVSLQDSKALDRLYIYETAAEISQEGIANSSAVLHPEGTVVVSRDAGVGKSAITADEMAVSQHFIAWLCGPRLNNHFLYYWLQYLKPTFEHIAIGSTIKTIGMPFFKSMKVPVPPKDEQERIQNILVGFDRRVFDGQREVDRLMIIKKGLMQDLLTGRVRVGKGTKAIV